MFEIKYVLWILAFVAIASVMDKLLIGVMIAAIIIVPTWKKAVKHGQNQMQRPHGR